MKWDDCLKGDLLTGCIFALAGYGAGSILVAVAVDVVRGILRAYGCLP